MAGLTRRRQAERNLFLSAKTAYREPTASIRLNSTGDGVRWLQHMLNQHGYVLAEDGIAGNMTIGALLDFQKKNNLVVDGICGPLTRAALKL